MPAAPRQKSERRLEERAARDERRCERAFFNIVTGLSPLQPTFRIGTEERVTSAGA
jgi:hypothetical protein